MYDQETRKKFLQEQGFDSRTTAWRSDIAAKELEGVLESSEYRPGIRYQCSVSSTALRFMPSNLFSAEDQLIFGNIFIAYDVDGKTGFAWGRAEHDGHVGFVSVSDLTADVRESTHYVGAPFTPILPRPDRQAEPIMTLCLNARVTIDAVDSADPIYGRIGEDMWVFLGDLRKIGDWFPNPVVPILPFQITTSYIWGYRNGAGFDCSGLTQAGWLAMGIPCPRDADQQEQDETLGQPISFDESLQGLQPFDVVYWPNHLAVMITDTHAIHAKGSEVRRVVIEPITTINEWRLAEYGKGVRTIKRRPI